MENNISYTARDYQELRGELVSFSKRMYPEISNDFNDNSVGSWFIDLVSSVGDSLNYYIDRCYQETNINSAEQKSSVLNAARINGVNIRGKKASMCEIMISCELPCSSVNIAQPDWSYAPLVKMGSVVGNSAYQFEIGENVNFAEQFNSNGISNRTFTPTRNNNGFVVSYTVTKSVLAYGGVSRVYKKILSDSDIEPFMEIILPDKGVMEVESIIFKEGGNLTTTPSLYEYFIGDEIYRIPQESLKTFRYFEVDSLSEQYRFDTQTMYVEDNDGIEVIASEYKNEMYDDFTETIDNGDTQTSRTTRYFKGIWKPITQKFITEYTDSGYLKIIFGGSTAVYDTSKLNENLTHYGEYMMSKMINNDMLGILPRAGWTMFVLYRTNGGASSNLAQGSINTIISMNCVFPNTKATDINVKNSVTKSMSVTNLTPSIGGKDEPSVSEIKYLTKYSVGSQGRCVTLKDYKARILNMPPKYGSPFRCNTLEENNKIIVPCLHLGADGKLTDYLPQPLVENMINYLSHYKNLTDYVVVKSGRIFNLGFEIDAFIDKNYTTNDVVVNILNTVRDYMNIEEHDMGEDIFIGDLERKINEIDGVIGLIELRVYSIYNGGYHNKSTMPKYYDYSESCEPTTQEFLLDLGEGVEAFRIDLDKTDRVLVGEYDSMFEILNPNSNIIVRPKLR